MEKPKIQAAMVLEILGRPAEHIKNALEMLATNLAAERGVKIINKKIHTPVPVKDSKDLFTTFAEIEVSFESLENYLRVIFAYMPSHIEIIHPEKISLSNYDLNDLGGLLVQRLHALDNVAKNTMAERDILMQKLKEVAPHLFQQIQQEKQQLQQQLKNSNSKTENKSKKKKKE
ncbi:hypothetical protein HYV50_05865 [Candidatus Pacearchaeota archaeon]|nr:hypothetical protein [Candidatus Pacearchaeota archaeon]